MPPKIVGLKVQVPVVFAPQFILNVVDEAVPAVIVYFNESV